MAVIVFSNQRTSLNLVANVLKQAGQPQVFTTIISEEISQRIAESKDDEIFLVIDWVFDLETGKQHLKSFVKNAPKDRLKVILSPSSTSWSVRRSADSRWAGATCRPETLPSQPALGICARSDRAASAQASARIADSGC